MTKNERAVIEANARKPYADKIRQMTDEMDKRNDAIECLRGALELLLRNASTNGCTSAGTDFSAWHRATAVDIGEVLTAARVALNNTERYKQ